MSSKPSYHEMLRQEFSSMIDAIDLPDINKQFLRSRWLEQVLWMEMKSERERKWYYILRLTAIIGGITLPALASLFLQSQPTVTFIQWVILAISLLVAITSATEEIFHFGERWRHYRHTVEWLKIEGWRFFQLSGPYHQYGSYPEAFRDFAGQVEETMKYEVDVYISKVIQEKQKEDKKQ
jgi:hypothetical protein